MSHVNNIVKKPWGYEYLAYENEQVALWILHIKKEENTSMHCHPNKTTGLVVVNGEVEVSFLSNKTKLSDLDKIMIRKGLFHSTKAISPAGATIMEIETPVDKSDLVRLRDNYGREGKPYENSTFEYPKENDCIWIENPLDLEPNIYRLADSKLVVMKIKDVDIFNELQDDKNVIFLQGGIITEYDINVAAAGDVVSTKVLKDLIKVFPKIRTNTIIMMVEK
tara:strand:+ start:1636 stop:2301 length:666 start_codon:yes stop_codon:yes gene_type:complete